jgi:RNA polymerase sigma-70 factor (ECF subfamily)
LTGCVDRVALNNAIKDLPQGYRTIFVLHEVEGYEHQEIAEMLGCSVGNSKSQLHKAKLRIRELLARAPEPCVAAIPEQRLSKPARPLFDEWDLAMASAVPMPVSAPQIAGPIA